MIEYDAFCGDVLCAFGEMIEQDSLLVKPGKFTVKLWNDNYGLHFSIYQHHDEEDYFFVVEKADKSWSVSFDTYVVGVLKIERAQWYRRSPDRIKFMKKYIQDCANILHSGDCTFRNGDFTWRKDVEAYEEKLYDLWERFDPLDRDHEAWKMFESGKADWYDLALELFDKE
jgi:hypothetical protein